MAWVPLETVLRQFALVSRQHVADATVGEWRTVTQKDGSTDIARRRGTPALWALADKYNSKARK